MISGTIYLIISQIVFLITNFALHIYLGRTLGPELYGIFGVISTFIIINELILLKGVYEAISKFVAEREEAAKSISSCSLKVLAIGGLAMGGIYFLVAGQIASLMNDLWLASYIRLSAFIIPIVGLSTVFLGLLNGLRQFGRQALISIIFNVVRLVSVFILVFLGYSVTGAIIGLIIADLFKLAMAKGLCRPIDIDTDFDRGKFIRFALQLMIIALITSLVVNIDLIAVKVLMKDNLQTGLYTAAVTIAKIPLFLMFPVSLTALPTISKSISDGDTMLTERNIKQSLRLLSIFVLPISLIIMATSDHFISLLYGGRYITASGPLTVLILGALFLSIKSVMFTVIVASGWLRYIIFIGLLSLFIDVILLITLINKMDLMGAAIATTVTHLFGLIISYVYIARKFMTNVIPFFLMRILLASLIIFLIALFYSPKGMMLFFYYTLLLCFYFVILILMKEISLSEFKLKIREVFWTGKLKRLIS